MDKKREVRRQIRNALPAKKLSDKVVKQIENSFPDLVNLLGPGVPANLVSQTISQTDTLYLNLRYYFISNNRQLLAQLYVEHGIIQTLVDQPVDDGFRAGFEIKTGQLSGEEIEELEYFIEQEQMIAAVAQAAKWTRLFGGGGVIIITGDDLTTPLDLSKIKQDAPFKLRAIDMWELYNTIQNVAKDDVALTETIEYYDYYGIKVHNSRVFIMRGKEAPSFIRPRLRGWGMSEVERMIRSINSYMKNQDVVFELLDEAKVDVYKMKGLNDAMASAAGTSKVASRIQTANTIKNFQNGIVLDGNDEYDQKQMNFSGLGEMLTQIRQGVACDVKMPMTKLFGISAAGFNSGEDDIENYNSMIEGEVRSKVKHIVVGVLQFACQIKFGFVPDDLKIIWKPLRILSAEQEEKVKDAQFNRTMSAFQSGLIQAEETKLSINKASLLPIEIDPDLPAGEPIGAMDDNVTDKGLGSAKVAPQA